MRSTIVATFLWAGCSRLQPSALRAAPRPDCPLVPPVPGVVELTVAGEPVRIEHGDAYLKDRKGRWELYTHLYDADWFERNYVVDADCAVSVLDDHGHAWPVLRTFDEDFEGIDHLRDLVGPERMWTAFTLQSPATPEVEDYVELRTCILEGGCGFVDNEIAPAPGDGSQALRFQSVPPSRSMVTAKASLETTAAWFVAGDDVWLGGRFRIDRGLPLTLLDLEGSHVVEGPGPRVMLFPGRRLGVELKWGEKPTWVSDAVFPVDEWAELVVHYRLDPGRDGVIQLWLDGALVLDATGQTLPLGDMVLDRVEVGISANDTRDGDTVVRADDVWFGTAPPAGYP
jgi:hypothetical protein